MSISDCAGTHLDDLPSLSVTRQVSCTPSICTTVARSGCPKALGATSMAAAQTMLSRCSVPGKDGRCIALLLSVSRTPQCRHQGQREDTMGAEERKPWHRASSQPKSSVIRASFFLSSHVAILGLSALAGRASVREDVLLSSENVHFLPAILVKKNLTFLRQYPSRTTHHVRTARVRAWPCAGIERVA